MPYLLGIYCENLDCSQSSDGLIYPVAAWDYVGGLDVTTAVDGWPIISWYASFLNHTRSLGGVLLSPAAKLHHNLYRRLFFRRLDAG